MRFVILIALVAGCGPAMPPEDTIEDPPRQAPDAAVPTRDSASLDLDAASVPAVDVRVASAPDTAAEMAPADAAPAPPRSVSAAEQLAVVQSLAALVCRTNVTFDAEDNVVSLGFSNHGVHCKKTGRSPTGLGDAHVAALLRLPALKRVRLESMPLTPTGYAILHKLPQLEAVLLAYVVPGDGSFMLPLRGTPNLRLLELKHLFSVTGSKVDQLPAFPQLEILELDVASAARGVAVPFIKKHPRLRSLQLHRSTITNADLAEIVAAAPDIEGLELKPSHGAMDAGVFEHVGKLKKLRVLQLTGLSVPAWEAGGRHLAGLTQLQVITGPVAPDTAARLRELLPGAYIGGGTMTPAQRELAHKDNPYFLRVVTPWHLNGRKQEYLFDKLQPTVGAEDIG